MRLPILVVACLVALAAPALAKEKPTLVVVELVPAARTKGVDPALVKLSERLSARLRARAAERYTVVPSKDTDGTAAWFCLRKPPACWTSIGKEAKADWMIYGSVEKVGDVFQVVVRLQRVSSKDGPQATVTEAVSASTIGDVTGLLAPQIYAKLHGEEVRQTR